LRLRLKKRLKQFKESEVAAAVDEVEEVDMKKNDLVDPDDAEPVEGLHRI
jgi:hypothetical protein